MRAFSIKLVVGCTALITALASAHRAHAADLTTPSFLVATRGLQDPFFQHSVVLMIPSTEPPLLAGVIINHPTKQLVHDLFPQARQMQNTAAMIYDGGPVEPDELTVIFRASSPIASATRVFDDTYIATGHKAVAAVLDDTRITNLRLISGKAQWLHDQLSSEVMSGAWYIVPAKSDLVFGDSSDLWPALVKGGDLEEAEMGQRAGQLVEIGYQPITSHWRLLAAPKPTEQNLPYRRLDGTNWQRQISPN
jgi:putative transcriptional regulator